MYGAICLISNRVLAFFFATVRLKMAAIMQEKEGLKVQNSQTIETVANKIAEIHNAIMF